MAMQNEETLAPEVEQVPVDPWAAAFAAFDKRDEEDSEAASDSQSGHDAGEQVSDTEGADLGDDAAQHEAGDGAGVEEVLGGPGDLGGEDSDEDVRFGWDDIDVSEESINNYRESFLDDIRNRTIVDVSNAYIKQGVRNVNGRLGANINDPDVCKRDSDGVPRFYNPETGREFTGDNPRRQAQEWVDDYNRELADAFNKTCSEYSQRLLEKEGGRLAVMEFAPKYKQLDPMRRAMFDSIIEDYEVLDKDGDVVGYTCDLDKALAAVNRQISAIQRRYAHQKVETKPEAKAPSGPALDTPSTSGGSGGSGRPSFKSIEEAMEWEQDRLLEKMKQKGRR